MGLLNRLRGWARSTGSNPQPTLSPPAEDIFNRLPKTHLGYHFSADGSYHYGARLFDEDDLYRFIERYRDFTPRLMVTTSRDHALFESLSGEVTFCELEFTPPADYPPWLADRAGFDEELQYFLGLIYHRPADEGEFIDWARACWIDEADLLAMATLCGENLHAYDCMGWVRADVAIERAAERFEQGIGG